MRYLIIFPLFLLLVGNGIAQSLSPEVVATAGDQFSSASINLEWTMGELVTETVEDGNVLTQGFHQPQIAITSINDPESLRKLVLSGPNPTQGLLSIQTEEDLTIRLFDMKGALLLTMEIDQPSANIDLSLFPDGIYMMQVSTQSSLSMTLNILKR